MISQTESIRLDSLFQLLVTYRLFIYFGGVFLIALPLLFRTLGIELSGIARTVVVVVTLAVMILTYLGEHRVGFPDSRTETPTSEYPLQMRLILILALLGIIVGIYVVVEVSTLIGLLFIIGAYLFGYMGYRNRLDEENR